MKKRQRRSARSRAGAKLRKVDGALAQREFAGYALADDAVERALSTGEYRGALEEYFGEENYQELRDLARQASARSVRGGPRVFILPGIMGSKLGRKRLLLDDVIWIDPIGILAGELNELALDQGKDDVVPLGVLLFAYLMIKLSLRAAGFDADFHPYDWRRDLPSLGAKLAKRINDEQKPVHLVAHSMGGLVARAALKAGAANVERLIMLGTPNYGSFAIPQALRGTYDVVKKVAAFDLAHGPEELASDVFSTFPGLYQMMPWKEKFSAVNLYDEATWPTTGPRPRADLLRAIEPVHAKLASGDKRFVLIAGVNQDTITGMRIENGDFAYEVSRAGDGTVPLDFARLEDVPTYYVEESHGSLPNNGIVRDAVVSILNGTAPQRVMTQWSPPRGAAVRVLRGAELRQNVYEGRRGKQLTARDIRVALAEVAAPPAPIGRRAAQAQAVPEGTARFENLVVGRRYQRELDVTLVKGNIADVDTRACVLGIFQEVTPTGAARALDDRLGGMIREFTERRMFTGVVGETFLMPVNRASLRTEMIMLAGMGTFDRFTPDMQELVSENVLRVFLRARVEEFATVILGGSTGSSVAAVVKQMFAGFLKALQDADRGQRFRRVILCERDEARYEELKRTVYDLASTPLFQGAELTINEEVFPPLDVSAMEGARALVSGRGEDPVYLFVRQLPSAPDSTVFQAAVLTAGGRAAIITEDAIPPKAELEAHLALTGGGRLKVKNEEELTAYGKKLGQLVLHPKIQEVLASPGLEERHLVVVHDLAASRIPWETLVIDGKSPALLQGISRRYLASNLSVAKWREEQRQDAILRVLLVVNPTQDLAGAAAEGKLVEEVLKAQRGVELTVVREQQATRARLLAELKGGRYDVVHYAGHAYYDRTDLSQSGIVCHGDEILTGPDLMSLPTLPSMAFFNACEAGRVRVWRPKTPRRKRASSRKEASPMADPLEVSVSFAEAFLRGGAATYVGTYWPVGDEPAEEFAKTLYGQLIEGQSVARSLLAARQTLKEHRFLDWADYIHYGSPDFVLKVRS